MSELSPEILRSLPEAVQETFETLAFAEISDWTIIGNFPDTLSVLGASISILQPFSGRLTLLLNPVQVRGLVETVYGLEVFASPEEDPVLLQDYVNELVNTIAGRLAASLAGDIAINLGLPEPCAQDPDPSGTDHPRTRVRFSIEGVPAWAGLEVG
jgi:hypothetical protein